MNKNEVTIIIPVYSANEKNNQLAQKCVKRILETSPGARIIVIDDCSPVIFDYSTLGVDYIFREQNSGIYSNWNLGVKESDSKYLCIVNSDIEPAKDDWLDQLFDAEQRFGGFAFSTPIDSKLEIERPFPQTFSHGLTYAPCFFVSRETLESLKDGTYFDEKFKLWFGDSDMWERAKSKNLQLTTTARSLVYHLGGGHNTVNLVENKKEIFDTDKKYFKDKWKQK